jgi:hypothetical protein
MSVESMAAASANPAIRLDDWLLTRARQTSSDRVATRQVFQYGPPCVRNDEDFREALTILSARGRARLEQVGRRRYVAVNPWLLSDPS